MTIGHIQEMIVIPEYFTLLLLLLAVVPCPLGVLEQPLGDRAPQTGWVVSAR